HAGLDASARTLLAELIAEASAGGATVVIASHEPELMAGLAGRSVTVTGGRVTAERRLGVPDPVASAAVAADAGDVGGAGDPDDLAVRFGTPVALVSADESVTHVA
ncbi:MAG: ATP-binding cassette domain-containing protein, partial [Acidimicrobiales bacterium]